MAHLPTWIRNMLSPAMAGLLMLGWTTPTIADTPTPELLTALGGWEKAGNLGSEAAVEGLAVEVRSDLLQLGARSFRFQSFDGAVYEAELERLDRSAIGGITWIGQVAEFGEHSRVLLSTYDGAVSGYLDTPEARYEIVPRPGGHVIVKLDPSRFAACATEEGEHDHSVGVEEFNVATKTLGLDGTKVDDFAHKSTSQIDIAVLYTEAAKEQVGGQSAILSTINSAVATVSDAFSSSSIDATLNLVGTEEAEKLGDTAGGGDGLVLELRGNSSGFSKSNEREHFENHPDLVGQSESGDSFGEVLARGDFDGDGYDDLAVGVPGEDLSSDTIVDTGLIWILYGSANGLDRTRSQKFHQNSSGLADSNESGDQFGYSLAAGDFDGDTFDDLAIGVPWESSGSDTRTGRVQILYGSSSGLSSTGSQSFEQDDLSVESNDDDDNFGWALTAGDFDDDGYQDLAIGIPGEVVIVNTTVFPGIRIQVPISSAGRVAVVYGSSAGLNSGDSAVFGQGSSGVGDSPETSDRFGQVLASGDFNDDEIADLVIGVPKEDQNGNDSGKIHVLYGTSAGLTGSGSQTFHQGNVGGSRAGGDQFGFSLAVGDFDDDGDADLAVGAPYDGNDAGEVNLLYGSTSGLSSAGVSIVGDQDDLYFGYALAAGDFDGDDYDDLAVGQPGYDRKDGDPDDEVVDIGLVEIFDGTSSGLTAGDTWAQSTGSISGQPEADDLFGAALAVGDFDSNGEPDLAVGVPGEGVSNQTNYFKTWMGSSSQVTSLRSTTNADLVGMIVEKLEDACGSAQTVLSTTSGDSSKFYQVTDRSCAVGNLTFAHEVGHLLGLAHDPENAGNSGACSDARGHFVSGQGRTVMSYSTKCSGGCTRVGLFSDPDIDFSFGDPSGISGERDNASCARLSVGNIAAYN